MKNTFPMRTGDVSYKIGLSPPAITGSWEVSMGFWGMNENSWSVSGVSGKIYDNSGYMLGSYSANDYTQLEGVIAGSGHSIYQDGILLSNTAQQLPNDYNMVSISGSYVEGYLPSVEIGGEEVLDNSLNQTVPFWRRETDNRLLFVTENATADFGFIETLSGMGFYVKTGNLSGNFNSQYVENQYGLIIFGSATTSGAYNDGAWNSLNTPMMSLNSHLVCPENLNWYGSFYTGFYSPSEYSNGYQTGAVFPQQYRSPSNVPSIWAEWPTQGWLKMFQTHDTSPNKIYEPYMVVDPAFGTGSSHHYVRFEFSSPNTTVTMSDGTHSVVKTFSSDVRPFESVEGFSDDLELTFTDVSGGPPAGVTVKLSNTLGGTGVADSSLTGTDWGGNQIYELGRVVPQVATYNVNNLYRRTTLTSGLYPTEEFNMYTGDISSAHGEGGDTFVASMDSGKLVTVWHHGFWTGELATGKFTVPELMVFSVTPTTTEWAGGYDMWSTLTPTGKQLFINAVAGFFIP